MKKRSLHQKKRKRYFVNENIRASQVKLINEKGELVGDLPTFQALKLARDAELDLVLIGPTQNPPIAKIIDFGKFQYEQDRKERKMRSNAKETEVKEIRISFNLSEHDKELKINRANEFLEKGHKVKLQMRLKGRENSYATRAFDVFREFKEKLTANFESEPQRQGQVLTTVLSKKSHEAKNPSSNK